jgi:hypothetical protein
MSLITEDLRNELGGLADHLGKRGSDGRLLVWSKRVWIGGT